MIDAAWESVFATRIPCVPNAIYPNSNKTAKERKSISGRIFFVRINRKINENSVIIMTRDIVICISVFKIGRGVNCVGVSAVSIFLSSVPRRLLAGVS